MYRRQRKTGRLARHRRLRAWKEASTKEEAFFSSGSPWLSEDQRNAQLSVHWLGRLRRRAFVRPAGVVAKGLVSEADTKKRQQKKNAAEALALCFV
jgi:hypothetical protein